jgi:hypothetical protein
MGFANLADFRVKKKPKDRLDRKRELQAAAEARP